MSKLPFKIQRGDTTLEKIMAHHIDPVRFPLTPALEKIRIRWAKVLTLFFNYYTPQQIVNKLMEEDDISQAQAYIDVKNAQIIYGNAMESDRKGKQAILYEYAAKYYQRAIQAKDLKAQAKALELMAKFGDIDNNENLDFNPDKFENKEIHVHLDKSLKKALVQVLSSGIGDFNALDVTEIEYEDLNKEDETNEEH